MTTIHIVSSARVGGGTGKSTVAKMLAAYLQRLFSHVAVIDASYYSTLYEDLHNIYSTMVERPLGQGVLYLSASVSNSLKPFIIVKSQNKILINDIEFINLIYKINDFIHDTNLHIICETNLPYDIIGAGEFINELTKFKSIEVFLWTVWNTNSLVSREEYDLHNDLLYTINSIPRVRWIYVHNPFAVSSGQPETSPSPAMEKCFRLPASKLCNAQDLLELCWDPSSIKIQDEICSNEEIWETAYANFIEGGERPLNVLPIFRSSLLWQRACLNHFNKHRLSDSSNVFDMFDQLSEMMLTEVFEPFFNTLFNGD